MQLLLGPRDATAAPNLITVSTVPAVQTTATGKQTAINFTITQGGASVTSAANSRLLNPNQNAALWTINVSLSDPVIDGNSIHMASLLRQIQPNDWLVFTAPGVTSQVVQVLSTLDVLGDASTSGGPWTVSDGVSPNARPIPIASHADHPKIGIVRLACGQPVFHQRPVRLGRGRCSC